MADKIKVTPSPIALMKVPGSLTASFTVENVNNGTMLIQMTCSVLGVKITPSRIAISQSQSREINVWCPSNISFPSSAQIKLSCSGMAAPFHEFDQLVPLVFPESSQVEDPVSTGSDTLECKICFRTYNGEVSDRVPRILKECGHTVCEECAKRIMIATGNQQIQCPFDRTITLIPNGNIQLLPKNFAILEMLQDAQNQAAQAKPSPNASKSTKLSISPCFESQFHTAVVFCKDCGEDFCKECFEKAHAMKVFAAHEKVPIDEKPVKLPSCERHPGMNADFFCNDPTCTIPTKTICLLCLSTDHSNHTHDPLEPIIRKELKGQNLVKKMKSREQEYADKLKIKLSTHESYRTQNSAFQAKVKEITDYFEEKKAKAILSLERFAKDKVNVLMSESVILNRELEKEIEDRERLEKALKARKGLELIDEICKVVEEKEDLPTEDNNNLPLDSFRISWRDGTELVCI